MHEETLFMKDGKFVVVAMDHGEMLGLLPGLEDPKAVIDSSIEGGADGVLSTFGVFKHYMPKGHIKTILRLDVGPSKFADHYWMEATDWHQHVSIETALRLGVDAVAVMLFPGGPAEMITTRIASRVAEEAHRVSLPVVIEAIPCECDSIKNRFDPQVVADSTRLAFDLGADYVKTVYTGTPDGFTKVTSNSPVPVGVLGGERMKSERDVLDVAHGSIAGGGNGVFIGRNIWQHKDPKAMVSALSAIVHDDASVDKAMKFI
jgi:fructose-bisphosphate aldolase, class I